MLASSRNWKTAGSLRVSTKNNPLRGYEELHMKFSFFMMPLHQPSENPALAFDRDIALIHYADALDFDEFFIGEHHSGGWETMPAPEMVLAKAAAQAHRIRPV